MSHDHHDHAEENTKPDGKDGRNILLAVLALLLFVWCVGSIKSCNAEANEKKAAAQQAAAAYAQAHPYIPVVPQAPQAAVRHGPATYRFGSDGCVTIPLSGEWSDYPKGGEISFIDLKTGQVVGKDKPGVDRNWSLPAGDYRICKEDVSAWGVEIRY